MKFKMDSQSYADLSIFSSNKSFFSVFGLFKGVKTLGAREKLEEMMRNPCNDLEFLRQRRDSIEFFKVSNFELDISHDQFDSITHYMKLNMGFLRSNLIDSFLTYIRDKWKSSQNYYDIRLGLTQLLSLLRYSAKLSLIFADDEVPPYLKKIGDKISALQEHQFVRYIATLSPKKTLRFYQLGKLDAFIRRKNSMAIIELLDIFYELDVFVSLAKVAREKNFCLPDYKNDQNVRIQATGLFHPGLSDPVSNDIVIDNSNNVIFLSGSNMSGKSSFLKSIGIAFYLSHIGFPVPARAFNTVIFNGLITTINLADNIQNGMSHYFSEVLRVKHVASELIETDRLFVLLDELFKGTNAKDAHDGSLMVLNGLADIQNSIFIISSHITELTTLLKKENVQFRYLENLMVDQKPKFTYLLKEGVSRDGIGMYFLQQENIKILLAQAAIAARS